MTDELVAIEGMTEAEAMSAYNADSKKGVIGAVIDFYYMITPGNERYADYIQRINIASWKRK
jgi:hypothetical protein